MNELTKHCPALPNLPKKKKAVFHHPLGMDLYDGLAMDLHAMTYAESILAYFGIGVDYATHSPDDWLIQQDIETGQIIVRSPIHGPGSITLPSNAKGLESRILEALCRSIIARRNAPCTHRYGASCICESNTAGSDQQTSLSIMPEPVYQLQKADGSWIDQTRASYDYNVEHGSATVRVLWTQPETKTAATPEPCESDSAGPDQQPSLSTTSEQLAWRELCRRLYVELWHCDKQMTSTLNDEGDPMWKTGYTVRDVLRDAKAALESPPSPDSPAVDAPDLLQMEEFIRGNGLSRASLFPADSNTLGGFVLACCAEIRKLRAAQVHYSHGAVRALLSDMEAIAAGAIKIPAKEFAMHALADFEAPPAQQTSVGVKAEGDLLRDGSKANALFEAWATQKKQGYDLSREYRALLATYLHPTTEHAWRGFCAAMLATKESHAA